jgi:uncharacterized membrane protein
MRGGRGVILALFAIASVLCVATEEVRVAKTGDTYYRFLIWNLALAWLPLLLAIAATAAARRAAPSAVAALGVGWLLFFPNAPYVLTDFIHLGKHPHGAPLWYDALMISAFAWMSLLVGLASLYLVHTLLVRRLRPVWSWLAVVAALALGSFGVYLGRFVRVNSWDALVRPGRVIDVVAHQLENPYQHPRMLGVLVLLTAFLAVAYAIVWAVAEVRTATTR